MASATFSSLLLLLLSFSFTTVHSSRAVPTTKTLDLVNPTTTTTTTTTAPLPQQEERIIYPRYVLRPSDLKLKHHEDDNQSLILSKLDHELALVKWLKPKLDYAISCFNDYQSLILSVFASDSAGVEWLKSKLDYALSCFNISDPEPAVPAAVDLTQVFPTDSNLTPQHLSAAVSVNRFPVTVNRTPVRLFLRIRTAAATTLLSNAPKIVRV